jgi:hypothetical protein
LYAQSMWSIFTGYDFMKMKFVKHKIEGVDPSFSKPKKSMWHPPYV